MTFFVLSGVLASLAISTNAGTSMHNPYYCYATDPIRPMVNMFADITSYEAIRQFNFTTFNPYVSTCTPTRFWYLGRYGSRLPAASMIQRMIDFAESSVQGDIIENFEAGRTTLCKEDFENIRNFTIKSDFGDMLRIENGAQLTDSGKFAMQNISKRFQLAFPDILTETYSRTRYHFRHTDASRTNASIRAFAVGLFGEAGAASVVYEPVPEVDWLLRPMNFCPAFSEETADSNSEREAFNHGPEIQEMIEQVNRKLGLRGSSQMDLDQIVTMWNWCKFTIAFAFKTTGSASPSPWCAPFSVAHQLLFEYREDLGFFYSNGYGVRNQRLLENLNCGVIQDLLRLVQSETDADTMVRVFITHTQEFQKILVALGTFRDVWPIHRHNYAQQSHRNWLTSLITSFSSNLSVVRFDCDDGDHDLMFLLNERPIMVPGCNRENGICKLSVIVNRFERFINANCSTFFCSSD